MWCTRARDYVLQFSTILIHIYKLLLFIHGLFACLLIDWLADERKIESVRVLRVRKIRTLYRHCRIFQFRWWWVHSIVVAPPRRRYSNRVQIVLVSPEPVVSTHTEWKHKKEKSVKIELYTGGKREKRNKGWVPLHRWASKRVHILILTHTKCDRPNKKKTKTHFLFAFLCVCVCVLFFPRRAVANEMQHHEILFTQMSFTLSISCKRTRISSSS